MRMFIPELRSKIRLTADWSFELFKEYRNTDLISAMNLDNRLESHKVSIPEGTVLTVDRIYIRQGQTDFNSVTFRVFDSPDELLMCKPKPRFWAKLSDVNQIEFEHYEEQK